MFNGYGGNATKPYYKDKLTLYTVKKSYAKGYEEVLKPVEYGYIFADVQPTNRELIFKTYGYYIDCQYVCYCDNDDININSIVMFDGAFYKIAKILKWHNHMEMYIKSKDGM